LTPETIKSEFGLYRYFGVASSVFEIDYNPLKELHTRLIKLG
jgi:hypothetical protein